MSAKIKKYIEQKCKEGLKNNYWFMTKQTLSDLDFVFDFPEIIHDFSESNQKSFEKFVIDNGKSQSDKNYRNAITSETLGLAKREGRSYNTIETTDAYKIIKEFRNTSDKFNVIRQAQIEKLCLNVNDNIKNNNNRPIFVIVFLYKIMYELWKKTEKYYLTYDEFILFVFRTTNYNEWSNIVDLIIEYRNNLKKFDSYTLSLIDKLRNHESVKQIRFMNIIYSLSCIKHIKNKDENYLTIADDKKSKEHIIHVINSFEKSEFCNLENKNIILDFVRSDKYFINKLQDCLSDKFRYINFEKIKNIEKDRFTKIKNDANKDCKQDSIILKKVNLYNDEFLELISKENSQKEKIEINVDNIEYGKQYHNSNNILILYNNENNFVIKGFINSVDIEFDDLEKSYKLRFDKNKLTIINDFINKSFNFLEKDKFTNEWIKKLIKVIKKLEKEIRIKNSVTRELELNNNLACRNSDSNPKTRKKREVNLLPRSASVILDALESANYKCEWDRGHKTFTTYSGENYVVGHHLIPIGFQDFFDVDIDIVENVISLCPNCHNRIHYSPDKNNLIEKFYLDRQKKLLSKCINITIDELKGFYE